MSRAVNQTYGLAVCPVECAFYGESLIFVISDSVVESVGILFFFTQILRNFAGCFADLFSACADSGILVIAVAVAAALTFFFVVEEYVGNVAGRVIAVVEFNLEDI